MIQMMYVDGFGGRRITASELSEYSSGGLHWAADSDEDLARSDVWHGPLEDVPAAEATVLGEEALEFARNLAETLDGATLPASEADTTGRIVIFADHRHRGGGNDGERRPRGRRRGLPSVEVCSEALGLKEAIADRWVDDDDDDDPLDLRAASSVTARNWALRIEKGFCYDETDEDDRHYDEDDDDGELERILRTTAMMDAELEDHFEFNMSDEVVCGPVLYGGRHGHAIVAVLGMRVWT